MAIDLLNRFTSGQVNNVMTTQSGSQTVSDSAEAARIVRSVYALKAGDTLQGELISAKGTDISLLLGDVVTLSAKLDKDLSLIPGQIMSFTVNSNKNGKLSLSPLFANTGMEQNAVKALDAAAIPVTDKTLLMAEELMKQGMPINKQTLSTIYRQMGMYPDTEVSDLVMMHKMNIPVNSENLSMMHLYRTNEQYLFSDLQGLGSQITNLLSDMVMNNQMDSVSAFIKGFVEIFSAGDQGQNAADASLRADMPISQDGTIPGTMSGEFVEIPESGQSINEEVIGRDTDSSQVSKDGRIIIAENEAQTLADTDTDAVIMKKETELLEFLRNDVMRSADGKQQLTQSLFSLLKEQLLMKPENVTSAEYIKEFYQQLDSQMSRLQDLLKSVGKEDSALAKETSTIKSNIQFMNQINELYHYVQLPIKMNHEQAKGDLYVYKRKQAKTGDDGRLTALLHLSMPTLGNMDVFLALENQKLSTRFCMEKEEMIDFIESHIEQLNERLMKKGYQVQTSVTSGIKEEKSVIENIMESEIPIPIMTSQSFDARC